MVAFQTRISARIAAAQGHPSSEEKPFQTLLDQARGLVERLAYVSLTGYDREDVLQEIRLTVYRCWKTYDPTRGASFYHLVTLAWNRRLARLITASSRCEAGDAICKPSAELAGEEDLYAVETREDIALLRRRLSPQLREVLDKVLLGHSVRTRDKRKLRTFVR